MDFRAVIERTGVAVATMNPVMNKIVVVILILLLGFILGRILGQLIVWGGKGLRLDDQVKKLTHHTLPAVRFLGTASSLLVYIATVVLVLDQLHVVPYVLYMIVGAVALVVLLSLILTIKDFFPNILAGISLKRKGFLQVGDKLFMDSLEGVVVKVTLLQTEVLLKNKDVVVVPNSVLVKKQLKLRKMPQTRVKGL
jgi:small-conductance mechanosensitive channel